MTELENRIFDIVRKIPCGRVMTYGQVALACGNANLARVVGNTMHKNPVPFLELARKTGFNCADLSPANVKDFKPVPCHRVVNASGRMGANFGLGGPEVQAKMLEAEGVEVRGSKVDLKKYGTNGDSDGD